MFREPFIQKRVIRGEQVHHAAVLFDDAAEQQFGLAAVALAKLVVPVRVEDAIRRSGRQIAQIQQLIAEILHQRSALGSASMR